MKVAIIGGGASGLSCAVEAYDEALRQRKQIEITVFEKNDRVGKKLLATGNGRCNLTNLNISKKFYNGDWNFASKALELFNAKSNIRFFESLGLFSKADSEGRVYPMSNQASSVLDSLRIALKNRNIPIKIQCDIKEIVKKGESYYIEKEKFDKVVIATGGKAAAKGFNGYELLEKLKIPVTKTAPCLVRLTTDDNVTKQLKGIRASATLTLKAGTEVKAKEKGEVLFSDNVISGIAAMQLSSYVARHFMKGASKMAVDVDFVSDFTYNELCEKITFICKSNKETPCENLLSAFMPKKIGVVILKKAGIKTDNNIGSLSKEQIEKIASYSKRYTFLINGTKDFSDAQVTAGGADTKAFNSETLECKTHKGLYCCGEILDVDGLCGGYNLQWAWSSGRLVGKSLLKG